MVLASLTLFASCSQYDNDNIEQNSIDALTLKQMHQDIKITLNESKNKTDVYSRSSEETEADRIYLENVEYYNEHGLADLFVKNNIDLEIISELELYQENEENENVYQLLIDNFNFETEEEAILLLSIIEVKNFVEQELSTSSMSNEQMQRISWGCAFAIAGTVGATLAFIGITGGGALLGALALKGLATAALIEACGEGWGDI